MNTMLMCLGRGGNNLVAEKYRTYPAPDAVASFGGRYDTTRFEMKFMDITTAQADEFKRAKQKFLFRGYFIVTARDNSTYRYDIEDLIIPFDIPTNIVNIGNSGDNVYIHIKPDTNAAVLIYTFTVRKDKLNQVKTALYVGSITYDE